MKKIIVISFIVFVLAIISVSGGEIEAFASHVATTPRYTVNGSWTVKNGTTVVSQGTGPILYQGNVVLNISMYSSYMSGQGSVKSNVKCNCGAFLKFFSKIKCFSDFSPDYTIFITAILQIKKE